MNKLIVNSDDFGYSRGINHAIIDTYREGILTSTTLMANTPGFEHAVKLAKKNPGLGVGVHLVLTFLKPISNDVASLVDENGYFHRPQNYLQDHHNINPNELYREWDAQIKKIVKAGIHPTHLDSHHHVHTYNEQHLKVFLKLARTYDLPIRKNYPYGQLAKDLKTTEYFEKSFDQITELSRAEQDLYLKRLLQKIKQSTSTELMCHVGYLDDFLMTTSTYTKNRPPQVDLLIDSPFAEVIRLDKNIQLSTFDEL